MPIDIGLAVAPEKVVAGNCFLWNNEADKDNLIEATVSIVETVRSGWYSIKVLAVHRIGQNLSKSGFGPDVEIHVPLSELSHHCTLTLAAEMGTYISQYGAKDLSYIPYPATVYANQLIAQEPEAVAIAAAIKAGALDDRPQ